MLPRRCLAEPPLLPPAEPFCWPAAFDGGGGGTSSRRAPPWAEQCIHA